MDKGVNPFNIKGDTTNDLDNSITPKTPKTPKYSTETKKYKKKEYTHEQIKELLTGYIEVSKSMWSDIPVNSHIRYFKKDGTFIRGGFVTSHWLNKEGKPFIHIANGFKKKAPGYATWPMAHESVSKVFKKPDTHSGIEMGVVREKTAEIIGQINKLVDIVKQQKNRLDSQENDIKKMYSIIRRLAEKK